MIVCAALKVRLKDADYETMIPCWRHANGYEILRDFDVPKDAIQYIDEGFMTSQGGFLDRKEAYAHALQCGQLPAEIRYQKGSVGAELYSEDIY